jgi:hypothetical protein
MAFTYTFVYVRKLKRTPTNAEAAVGTGTKDPSLRAAQKTRLTSRGYCETLKLSKYCGGRTRFPK